MIANISVFLAHSYKIFVKKETVPINLIIIESYTSHVMKFLYAYSKTFDLFALKYLLLKQKNIKTSLLIEANHHSLSSFNELDMAEAVRINRKFST